MNSRISVDLQENIVIKTDTCATAGELLAAVCEYPFLIDVIIEQTLPKLQKYAEFWLRTKDRHSVYDRRTHIGQSDNKT